MQKFLPIFESVLFWLYLGLIITIPLYMKFPLFGVEGTFAAIRLEDILIAAAYLTWGFYLILSGKVKKLFSDRLNQAIGVFFLIGLVSVFSGVFLTQMVPAHIGALHWLRRLEMMLLLPLTLTVIRTKRQVFVSLGTLSLVLFIANIYGLGQKFFNFPVVSTTTSELAQGVVYFTGGTGRLSSTFAGHYDLAVFLFFGIILIAAFAFFFLDKGKEIKLTKLEKKVYFAWFALLAAGSAVILVMTAARLSFVAAIFGVVSVLFLLKKKRLIFVILFITLLALIYPSELRNRFVATFTVNIQRSWEGYFSEHESQVDRSRLNIPTLPVTYLRYSPEEGRAPDIVPGEPVDTTDLGVYRSFEIRTQVEWPRAVRAFTKNPILGTGYGSLGLATDNDLLRSLGEVGILGTIAFALILWEIIRRIWNLYKTRRGFVRYFSAGTISLILAFLINSLFIDVFEASKIASLFWIILGINLAAAKVQGTKDKKDNA